jgi:hypothetical protein
MLNADRLLLDRITTLGEQLSTIGRTSERKKIIVEIVRSCVEALELKITAEDRETFREAMNEVLRRQNGAGKQIISNRDRLQIIMNIDLQLGEVDSVEDYLNKKKVETIDESEEEVSWTPNFSGILSKPPDAINK